MKGSDKPYEVGKGKPPKEHQFKRGEVHNPGGKSSLQATLERRNAEAAMRIRSKLLGAVERFLSADGGITQEDADKVAVAMVEAAMLKLLKDSEDRGLGAPVQPHTSPDGSMTPVFVIRDMTKDG